MPKQPKFVHPLKAVRQVLGNLSQLEFGKRVDYSASAIQSIELGRLPMPEELAREAMRLTGVSPDCLRKGRGKAISLLDGPLNQESYEAWRTLLSHANEAVVSKFFEILLPRLLLLFLAAGKRKQGYVVGEFLREWMRDTEERFELTAQMDLILSEIKGAGGVKASELDVPLTDVPEKSLKIKGQKPKQIAANAALVQRVVSFGPLPGAPLFVARAELLAGSLESLEHFIWSKTGYSDHLPKRYKLLPGGLSDKDLQAKDKLSELALKSRTLGVR